LLGTSDLLPAYIWVVCVAEPVKTPIAAGLERCGQSIAVIAVSNATVVGTPYITTILLRAALSRTFATAWDDKVELVVPKVIAGSRHLNDHLLAVDGTRSKCQAE
jgi:hypothetical protein